MQKCFDFFLNFTCKSSETNQRCFMNETLLNFTEFKIAINAKHFCIKNSLKFLHLVKKLMKVNKKQAKFNNVKNILIHDNGTFLQFL